MYGMKVVASRLRRQVEANYTSVASEVRVQRRPVRRAQRDHRPALVAPRLRRRCIQRAAARDHPRSRRHVLVGVDDQLQVLCTVATLDMKAYPGGKTFLADYKKAYGVANPGSVLDLRLRSPLSWVSTRWRRSRPV